mgnify:CR=1 FL=1
MTKRILLFVATCFLFLLLITVVFWYQVNRYLDTPLAITAETNTITISNGTSFSKLAYKLAERSVLSKPRWFVGYARLLDQTNKIKAGEYFLEEGTTPRALLHIVVSGKVVQHQITVIEGSTFREMLTEIASQPKLESTLTESSDDEIIERLGIEGEHTEGRFFPDTYNYNKGMSDVDILQRAHRKMENVLSTLWQKRDEKLPYKTPYDALIMASIVEKETAVDTEREQIAGVFIRRLKKGMRLQTDPTVIYGLGSEYQGNLTRVHLKQLTPYNTYRIKGLPPTPIALPGQRSIYAALHPDESNSLYFVAKGDGTHMFADTLEQHNKNVDQFQRKRRIKNYKSTPSH